MIFFFSLVLAINFKRKYSYKEAGLFVLYLFSMQLRITIFLFAPVWYAIKVCGIPMFCLILLKNLKKNRKIRLLYFLSI
jgi:hypothetical protein